MRAVVKFAPGVGNVDVREIAEPEAADGWVKIAVRAAGICGTDLHIYKDEYRSWPPVVLGHEVAGVVAAIGRGVTSVQPGDRVTTETYVSTCGVCLFCRSGRVNLCPERRSIGSAVDGGFTSYLVVPERNLHRLPDAVSDVAGALTEPLACVVHAVHDLPVGAAGTTEQPGIAVVAGPGAIGLLTLQVVKATGAKVVVLGASGDEHRLELAAQLGADYTFDVDRDPFSEVVLELTEGYGADAVYECSGAGPAAVSLLELVRRGGRYTQVGLFGKPIVWNLDQICYKEVLVTGSNASVPSAWERALALLASGAVRTEPLVTDIYPITEWRSAFDAFERRSGVKTVLRPEEVAG